MNKMTTAQIKKAILPKALSKEHPYWMNESKIKSVFNNINLMKDDMTKKQFDGLWNWARGLEAKYL